MSKDELKRKLRAAQEEINNLERQIIDICTDREQQTRDIIVERDRRLDGYRAMVNQAHDQVTNTQQHLIRTQDALASASYQADQYLNLIGSFIINEHDGEWAFSQEDYLRSFSIKIMVDGDAVKITTAEMPSPAPAPEKTTDDILMMLAQRIAAPVVNNCINAEAPMKAGDHG